MISAKNATNPRTTKTPKSSPFSHGFGRGIKGKRTTKGSCIHALTNPQENSLEISPRKSLKKAPKITKKENREELKQALRNHAESSTHAMKVHTRSSFRPIILPLTRSHHEALKLVLEIPREKGRGK
jgi:ABC-type oligopeptide transport system ATPase subunit